ncbi:class I SAM-dependent methyltransferase [Ramlibacter sp. AN1133]|uniref:class I SAM-dependent methyltransferase n=1 Tax=Ramlibacter sp. AN1133 TaxID=3133429 RepID=UPI0030C2E260
MNQDALFLRDEGDAWYRRNREHLPPPDVAGEQEDVAFLSDALSPFRDRIVRVLEIGCSSGIKLEALCDRLAARGDGIEPSRMAVDEGNARIKSVDIRLQVGTGERLPFEAATFDLIHFGFCLYLFGRESLMQSLAEADRVLRPGGFLAITDFDPGLRQKRRYTHREGVFSAKQDYSDIYTSSGLYYLMAKHSFSHRRPFFDEDPGERVSTSILFKEVDGYPVVS